MLKLRMAFAIGTEPVHKSLASESSKAPAEKTLAGRALWVRELVGFGVIEGAEWRDAQDVDADGRATGYLDRQLLLQVM